MTNEFRPEIGKLMDMQFDERFGFKYTVWFDYTKKLMREIKAGDLLAVPNFSHSDGEGHYSILTTTSIMPFHYATTGDQMSGYPVFLEKTRDEAFKDFYKQDEESTEETTKIRVIASPTGLELQKNPTYHVVEESQIPMFGAGVNVLDLGLVGNIFNSGLDQETTITPGNLRKGDVEIKLKVEDLIRTHIGIFGYTGTGKSNLVSTLVYKLLTQSEIPVNVVIFDLMGEYTSLLSDVLENVNGYMCFLGKESIPKAVQNYMTGSGDIESARDAFMRNMYVPVQLRNETQLKKYEQLIQRLFENGKIKIHQEKYDTMEQFLKSTSVPHTSSAESKRTMGKIYGMYKSKKFEPDQVTKLLETLDGELEAAKNAGTQELLYGWIQAAKKQTDIFEPQEQFQADRKDLVKSLLDIKNPKPSLYIIQGEDEDQIREFAYDVVANPVQSVYGERRKQGWNKPLTLFIFDEADEFIPQENPGSYKKSTEAVETIARRGRKFGLGVTIATQRVTYLNTNIMAQPHTYFISKLPRFSDRERVTDAFGTSEEVLAETFKFGKGDWLVISHDATGLKSVPIPVHSDNTEERIKNMNV